VFRLCHQFPLFSSPSHSCPHIASTCRIPRRCEVRKSEQKADTALCSVTCSWVTGTSLVARPCLHSPVSPWSHEVTHIRVLLCCHSAAGPCDTRSC
jgi:hypothetical protein